MEFIFNFLKKINIFLKQRKKDILSFWSFFHIKIYLFILILANFFLWIIAYNIFNRVSQDLIVLHYNVDFGVNLIGSVKTIFTIPLLGLMIIIFNFFIVLFFQHSKYFKFLSHLLLAPAIMAHLFLLASLASIYLVNF